MIQYVVAVPAAPSPTCEITAEVQKLVMERTNIQVLSQPPRQDFDYYKVTLDITNINTFQPEGASSCDNSYIEFAEKTGQILKLTEFNKNRIQAGQKIKAKIHFQGDEWLNGYYLSDIQILSYGEVKAVPIGIAIDKHKNYWYYIISNFFLLVVTVLYIVLKRRNK